MNMCCYCDEFGMNIFNSHVILFFIQKIVELEPNVVLRVVHRSRLLEDGAVGSGDGTPVAKLNESASALHSGTYPLARTKEIIDLVRPTKKREREDEKRGSRSGPVPFKGHETEWQEGDLIYVDVATWYNYGFSPFPKGIKWYCEGVVLRVANRKYLLRFECFNESYEKPKSYMLVR